MFIKAIKIKKSSFMVLVAAVVIIIVAVVMAVVAGAQEGVTYQLKTEKQRQKFLADMGWEVSEEYLECKVVIIPEKFNDVYEKYNKLQKKQGFDLEKFKGKTVEIYTYEVKNYPDHEKNIIASLMVYEGELIGGDVSCIELNGFMQGLKKP
ncbi:MAG: DUF4830 domain-containing protein [Oscillospiraceae bacterium]|nr:DUF4830 domain-containing protein [Oscillospiraceae bacterium]MBQ8378169.1 DUF4830 domain-containing protein [Oscillospiraceae bacterium]MBQ8884080.1 DUF4830 domain-containing protein [Oscillospiraceae bacterium]